MRNYDSESEINDFDLVELFNHSIISNEGGNTNSTHITTSN